MAGATETLYTWILTTLPIVPIKGSAKCQQPFVVNERSVVAPVSGGPTIMVEF